MTECNSEQFEFDSTLGTRQIVAEFSGGTITSYAGSLLLKDTEAKMNLLTRFNECFLEGRSPKRIEHSLEQMLRQRVYGLALAMKISTITTCCSWMRRWQRWRARQNRARTCWRARAH